MPADPKTVYVMGAGFSREAGFPLQAEILDRILRFQIDIMHAPRHAVETFGPAQTRVAEFIGRVFGTSQRPPLEDVFTLLDQTIARREYCSGYSWGELETIRDALKRAVLFVFHQAGLDVPDDARRFYDALSVYLLTRRVAPRRRDSPFSIVLLNWDSLLEDSLCRVIEGLHGQRRADIDYCCPTNPIGASCPHTPSLMQEAKRLFNVKVMKLHGSVNWLICPNCSRLYTGVGGREDVWSQYVRPQRCPFCAQIAGSGQEGEAPGDEAPEGEAREAEAREGGVRPPLLEPFFLTPTFVKVFDNAHVQMTWHSAYAELAEATEVVFVGYSLPDADFHVRTLMRRAVRPSAQVTVVLTERDEPVRNTPQRLRHMYPTIRYRAFFGEDRVRCELGGVRAYFEGVIGPNEFARGMSDLRSRVRLRFRR